MNPTLQRNVENTYQQFISQVQQALRAKGHSEIRRLFHLITWGDARYAYDDGMTPTEYANFVDTKCPLFD